MAIYVAVNYDMRDMIKRYDKEFYLSQLDKFIKGVMAGIIIITPISGGTFLLIIGMYEEFMGDISSFKFLKWTSFIIGTVVGILISGRIFVNLLETYTGAISSFLLGCIIASLRSIIGENYRPSSKRAGVLAVGLILGLYLSGLNELIPTEAGDPNLIRMFVGGAIASVAMIMPGVSAGPLMILLGIYYPIMKALATFDWGILIVYLVGSIAGIVGLANMIDKLYNKAKATLSWFFVGLIVGSANVFLPYIFEGTVSYIFFAMVGFGLVWTWDKKNRRG